MELRAKKRESHPAPGQTEDTGQDPGKEGRRQTEDTGQDPGKELRAGPGLLLQLCEDKPGAQGSGSSLVALGGSPPCRDPPGAA